LGWLPTGSLRKVSAYTHSPFPSFAWRDMFTPPRNVPCRAMSRPDRLLCSWYDRQGGTAKVLRGLCTRAHRRVFDDPPRARVHNHSMGCPPYGHWVRNRCDRGSGKYRQPSQHR
jgi:hypothetical protein